MSRFIINGGKKLSGSIQVAGNKNAALPIMAATLLTHEDVTLSNVPEIKDVSVMADILRHIGASVEKVNSHTYTINTKNVTSHKVPLELAKQLRASVLLIGPLLARFGKVELSHPGGDVIGRRSIDSHLNALQNLGCTVDHSDDSYKISRNKKLSVKTIVFLDEASVTATENVLMALAFEGHEVILENFAREPHVIELIRFLKTAGMNITMSDFLGGFLSIRGVRKLKGQTHVVSSDYVEMGTFIALAAATQSDISIKADNFDMIQSPFYVLSQMNVSFKKEGDTLHISPSSIHASLHKIQAGPYPNFPTDLMSPFIVLATQAKGQTLLHDPMYESRMFFVDKLIRMGAHITICDPHRVIVYGPTTLKPQHLNSPDIRAGMALVIASLCATGESIIENAEIIERGYERLAERLSALGADIRKDG